MAGTASSRGVGMSVGRLEAFSDGVLAIVITLGLALLYLLPTPDVRGAAPEGRP